MFFWEFEYQGCTCWYSNVLPSHLRSCYRSGPAFAILRCLVFIEGIRIANYKPPVAFENLHYVSKNNMRYSFNRSLHKDNSQRSLRVPDLAYSSWWCQARFCIQPPISRTFLESGGNIDSAITRCRLSSLHIVFGGLNTYCTWIFIV